MTPIDPNDAKDEAVKTLVENFLRRRSGDLTRIREARDAKNFAAIATIGHNLRGNGASYGFPKLSAIGEALEKAALAADDAIISSELEHLIAELTRIDASRKK
jgi:HPt (histidine-containing phosphotransfer) domain-containing protein